MTLQLCTFHVGALLVGVEVDRLQEVLRGGALTPVPLADARVVGLLNLRGKIVTVIDARRLLGLAGDEPTEPTYAVIRTEDEAMSLLVDSEAEVVDVDESSFEDLPDTVSPTIRGVVRGAYKLDHALVLHIDIDRARSVPVA